MKISFIILLFLIMSGVAFSQQSNPTAVMTNTVYLKKSKTQKTTAWVLLGGGALLNIAGMAIGLSESTDALVSILTPEPKEPSSTGPVLLLAGTASMLSSIPFFISSNRNKKKGLSFLIKNEKVSIVKNGCFTSRSAPSLTLKILL